MSLKWCLAFLFLVSCASTSQNSSLSLSSEYDYTEVVEAATQKKQVYDGLVNVLDVRATLLNTNVSRLQVDQYAHMYQWDEKTFANEKAKTETNLSKQTDVFLSFFVPDRKHDDLAKSTSKWKIFLDVAGKRYEGTAKKVKTIFAEIKVLYPDHTRWSTPYMVTFPVPTSLVDNSSPKLTITGPVGSALLAF